ncbi:MAG TPA: glycosyltransferase [Methylomirabilota bacterium]|nr:glycosyltransferase [Methylomirabilota bacterium]
MRLRVAMYTTARERCGIADYSAALAGPLRAHVDLDTVVLQPNRLNPLAIAADGRRLSRADVAHVQHTYSFFGVDQLTYTLAWRLLRRTIRVPLVVTAHTVRPAGPARYEGGLGSALANAVGAPAWHDVETFRRAAAVIVHARLHRDRLVARGVSAERCVVVPPGVPPRVAVDPAAVTAFRARHGLGSRPVVGVFGFVERGKRFALVVDALAELGGGREAPALLIAGGPRLAEHEAVVAEVRAEARALGDRLVVTGYLPPAAVPVALEAMDVVVVPYATEDSVSYSLHVALAQGRPVVATALAPVRELEERGRCVALVSPDDPHDLAKTLGALLEDAAARRRLAEAARQYAAAESVEVAARRTAEVYARVREAAR